MMKVNEIIESKKELNLKQANEMSLEEIEKILPYTDQIIKWAQGIKNYCTAKALEGETIKGFKLVKGRTSREFINEKEAKDFLLKQGFKRDDLVTEKFITPPQVEKLVGRKFYRENIAEMVNIKEGNLTLVPEDDKREAVVINPLDSFAEILEEYDIE